MTKIKISEFDAAKYLTSDKAIAEYLSIILEENDAELFMQAFQNVIRAKGIAQLARETGLNRESLYKTISQGAKPRFETILKLIDASGFSLVLKPSKKLAHH
jgi:probable addiction module antidote protein